MKLWGKYKTYLRWHRKIFYYLDRYYLKNDKKSLYIEGFRILKKNVIDVYRTKLFEAIVNQLNKERNQDAVNEENIKAAIRIYEITTYEKTIVIGQDPLHPSGFDYSPGLAKPSKDYYNEHFEKPYLKKIE